MKYPLMNYIFLLLAVLSAEYIILLAIQTKPNERFECAEFPITPKERKMICEHRYYPHAKISSEKSAIINQRQKQLNCFFTKPLTSLCKEGDKIFDPYYKPRSE